MPVPVLLAGAALTPFGKAQEPLLELLAQAAGQALDQAGAPKIDAVYLGVMNAEEFTGEGNLAAALTDRLGLEGAASSRVETASSTGAGALESAFYAVASGYCHNVLVVAGEKMTGLPGGVTTRILAEVIAPVERRYGASMPALAALIARAYAQRHGLDLEQVTEAMARVAVKNHARGALNPYAQFQKPITLDKHRAARPVAEPLGLFDCAPITDGAAAVVLSQRRGRVRLAGVGHATDSAAVCRRGSLTSFNSTRQAAAAAYEMAKVNPDEVDFAEVHDAFTIFELIGSEDLGLFPEGQGWRAALEGETEADGRVPINPSGGLKARGHPVGASGLAQVVEAFWLLTGHVEPAQTLPQKPKVALTQSIGGLGNNNLVTLLVDAERPIKPVGPWTSRYHRPLTPLAPPVPSPTPAESLAGVESYTTLYNPPEGFQAPLSLVLARAGGGWRTLAHLPEGDFPPLGGAVLLTLENGLYQARPVKDAERAMIYLQQAWRKLPRRLGLGKRASTEDEE